MNDFDTSKLPAMGFDIQRAVPGREDWFTSDGSRYQIDGLCGPDWKQYDTAQDAWYFGVWVNIAARQVVTYAEGDLTIGTFATDSALGAELQRMAEFYGAPPPAFIVIDDDSSVTHYFDPRPTV